MQFISSTSPRSVNVISNTLEAKEGIVQLLSTKNIANCSLL